MPFARQALLSVAVLAAALYVWVAHVPAAHPVLDRLGLLDLLGVEPAAAVDQPDGGRGGGAARVVVAEVEDRVKVDRITAIGDGRAQRSVTVRSEAVGLITEVPVSADRRVEKGALMVRLDGAAERIALERAELVLRDARVDNERVRQLGGSGAITEVREREVELALRTAELDVRQAQFDLDQREVRAPIAGIVGILDIEAGDRVAAQDVLGVITDRSSILIDFRIPERVIGEVEVGMAVEVTPLGLRDLTLQGRISAIDNVVDRASRTLRVQARVDNDDDRLRAGMAFSVALTLPGDTLLALDPLALQWSSDGSFVWAIRDGKALSVPVRIVQRDSDAVLVEAELAAGDRIVTEGVQSLRPGAEVEIAGGGAAEARTGDAPAQPG